ncbi:hypothetical protein HZS_7507 [Henneguya salminicola]|nr:hypothetical protein HZS_7507 [Henneguya salminicola]
MTDLETSIQQDNNSSTHRRRSRTCFSKTQVDELESVFLSTPYPDSNMRQKLVNSLKIEEPIIQIWFKNRRAKSRRNLKSHNSNKIHIGSYTYPLQQDMMPPNSCPYSGPSKNISDENSRYSSNCFYNPHSMNPLLSSNFVNMPHMFQCYNGQMNPMSRSNPTPQYVLYNTNMDPNFVNFRPNYSNNNSSYPVVVPNDVEHTYVSVDENENVPS